MNRLRHHLISFAYLATLVTGQATAAVAPAASVGAKPNVLLILVDDLKPALGAYGDKSAITPQMDALAARGIRFDRAYCNIAVCAPSRFALITGSRCTTLGIYGFQSDFRRVYPKAITLPQHFMAHGYRAESLGKVLHFGHGCQLDDASWSVPHFKDKVVEYLVPGSTGGKLTREEALFENINVPEKDRPLPRGAAWEAPEVADEAYADGRVAAEAVRRLHAAKNKPDQPFFMAVGFARPHLPFSVPKKYWDLYDPAKLPMPEFEKAPAGTPKFALKRGGEINNYAPIPTDLADQPFPEDMKRKLIHGYYAGVTYADAQIGKVLAALQETGLQENTIVVLWGDHGYLLGEMNSWTKHCNYELANRIPLLIAGPGVTKPGSTAQLAESVDIYPTLAELAGLPPVQSPQPQDGQSLVPVLKNPAHRLAKNHAYHCYPRGDRMGRAIRTDRYRLVEWKPMGSPRDQAVLELYDYHDGLVEKKNLAEEKLPIVAELRKLLDSHPEARK